MIDEQKIPQFPKDEISLKELIIYSRIYGSAIKKVWWRILLLAIVLSLTSYLYFSAKPSLYEARLTFMLNEDEGNYLNGMTSILGQFGLPISNQRVNISKVLELSTSRKIIQKAIFKKEEVGGEMDFLANHLLDVYGFGEKWSNSKSGISNLKFSHTDYKEFSINENFVLQSLCIAIAGTPANRSNALLETDFGQNTTIMSYVMTTEDEDLSYHLTNAIFNATSDFYVEKSTEKQQITHKVLLTKRDSTLKMLDEMEYQFADLSDRSSGLFSKRAEVKRERARAEMIQISSGLAKLEENIALTEFAIENNTPILQIIDAPIFPLKEVKIGWNKSVLIGFLSGLILGIFLSIIAKFYDLTIK